MNRVDSELRQLLRGGGAPAELAQITNKVAGQHAPPVALDKVLALWNGLDVSVEELDGDGYLVEIGGRSGELLVNSRVPRTRRRFTLAHELGHWVLALDPMRRDLMPRAEVEKWCDEFARELLIPPQFLTPLLSQTDRPLLRLVTGLPPRFAVSQEAMWIQISRYTDISVVMIGRSTKEFASRRARPSDRTALVAQAVRFREAGERESHDFCGDGFFGEVGRVGTAVIAVAKHVEESSQSSRPES